MGVVDMEIVVPLVAAAVIKGVVVVVVVADRNAWEGEAGEDDGDGDGGCTR